MLHFLTFMMALPAILGSTLPNVNSASKYASICKDIAISVSNSSNVLYPGHAGWANASHHWLSNCEEQSVCIFEPGSVKDISKVIRILAGSKTPFGIKGGGHTTNAGFSSSPGVLIAMHRMKAFSYTVNASTVKIGAGNLWDDVYRQLEPHGVQAVGGRILNVGVGGFLLGGGYSWLTNRRGLGVDNVVEMEIVLPNGSIVTASQASNPDLYFALKGGFNNFGIVTSFTLNVWPVGKVWGGLMKFEGEANIQRVIQATARYQAMNDDPDGNLIANYAVKSGSPGQFQVVMFHNGANPGTLFDDFLAIPSSYKDVTVRSFTEFLTAVSFIFENPSYLRGTQNSISFHNLTTDIIATAVKQVDYYSGPGSFANGTIISAEIEPFMSRPDDGVMMKTAGLSAYPHTMYFSPTVLWWAWPEAKSDAIAKENIIQAVSEIRKATVQDGQNVTDLPLYPNYALEDAPLESMYLSNVPRIREIRRQYDPNGVMNLTGGYKF